MRVNKGIQLLVCSTACLAIFSSCGTSEVQEVRSIVSVAEELPDAGLDAIQSEFPGSATYATSIDSLLGKLKRYGIHPDLILWGQSTCVDDITNTKNKLVHSEIKGPFIFGGLSGLPFTGITGVGAFAHHVPAEGTALMFVGPHIGYSSEKGWGKILRHGQHEPSTCCGALVAALTKLQNNGITPGNPSADDYQEQVIEQLALSHKDEILSSRIPLMTLTRLVTKEAELQMTQYAHAVKERHFSYAVVVVGVIINTDYQHDDYLWIDHIAIKDIKNDKWIVGGEKIPR